MKLKEILSVPLQPPRDTLKHFDLQKGEEISTAENNPVWHYISSSNSNFECYIVKDERTNEIAAYVAGSKVQFENKIYLQVEDARTMPKFRKQGYMTALYQVLQHHLHIALISDAEQSSPMKNIWKHANTVFDTKTNTLIPRKEVPEDELYTASLEQDKETKKLKAYRYRLVFEATYHDGILPELPKGFLRDRVNYTHYENKGKYE